MTNPGKKKSFKFRLGLILLVANIPIGQLGLLATGGLYAKSGHAWWLGIGTVIYALTWGMWGLGLFLTGSAGLEYLRKRKEEKRRKLDD